MKCKIFQAEKEICKVGGLNPIEILLGVIICEMKTKDKGGEGRRGGRERERKRGKKKPSRVSLFDFYKRRGEKKRFLADVGAL